ISAFGTAIGTIVNFGFEIVHAAGTAIGTIVNLGGTESLAGGIASGTIVNSGGHQDVLIGGTTVGTIVNSGGFEDVGKAGVASGTIVNLGGTEFVLNGGTARGTSVNSGGLEEVFAGGTASATTINGGTLEVAGGASISGPITFTSAGGILELDASQSFHGTIAGFASPPGVTEEIDLRDISFGKKTKLSFHEDKNNLSGTLTVTDGTHTASLTLLGQYSANDFSLASDGHGGTMGTYPQPHPPLAGSPPSPLLAPPPLAKRPGPPRG